GVNEVVIEVKLLVRFGSVTPAGGWTPAVFVTGLVAFAGMSAVMTNVATPLIASDMVVLIGLLKTCPGVQLEPRPVAQHVQLPFVEARASPLGRASLMVTFAAVDGP